MKKQLKKLNALFQEFGLKKNGDWHRSPLKPNSDVKILDPTYKDEYQKNIVCVVAAHRRIKLLNFVLNYLNKLDFRKIVVVYSLPDEKKTAKKYDKVSAVFSPNLPVSKKWQKGVEHSRKFNPDGVMILGSDDIITPGYLDYVKKQISDNYDYISNKRWYSTYLTNNNFYVGEFRYLKERVDGLGSGRVYSKRVLDKLKWKLYNFNKNKSLDGTSYKLAEKHIKKKIIVNNLHQMNVILLKTEDNAKSISVTNGFFNWVHSCTVKRKVLEKVSLFRIGESNVYEILCDIFSYNNSKN